MNYVKLFALTVTIILFIAHLNSRSCFRDRLMSKYMKAERCVFCVNSLL